jgi:Flp pilus assembly protein TadG
MGPCRASRPGSFLSMGKPMFQALLRAARRSRPGGASARPGERGSIAVVAAVALVALIGMAALVVDGGYLAMRRRALQGVADAAALSGGFSLPTSATAISQAKSIATANGYTNGVKGATVTVNSPYSSDTRRVEVMIQTTVPTFLGAALRINTGTLIARAVAKVDPPDAAIFAGSTACAGSACGDALCFQGQGNDIQGDLHSNGSIFVSGNNTTSVGNVEYGNSCSPHSVNGGVVTTSGPTNVATQPYPLSWTAADFTCNYYPSGGNITNTGSWWQSGNWYSTGVLKPGVYCSTGGVGLQINGSNITGNITLVSDGPIQINGNSTNFTAYRNNVLAYTSYAPASSSTAVIQFGNDSLTWTGDIFAPNGLIAANGTGDNITGSIVGKYVQIGATNWTMNSGAGSSKLPYLTE